MGSPLTQGGEVWQVALLDHGIQDTPRCPVQSKQQDTPLLHRMETPYG